MSKEKENLGAIGVGLALSIPAAIWAGYWGSKAYNMVAVDAGLVVLKQVHWMSLSAIVGIMFAKVDDDAFTWGYLAKWVSRWLSRPLLAYGFVCLYFWLMR